MESKNITSILDLNSDDINEIFKVTSTLKNSDVKEHTGTLAGKSLGMIFEKSSMRTRVSFEVAMASLGGHAVYLTQNDIYLGKRETVKDGAHVLSRYVNCITIRTYAQETVEELARESTVPVINALSDYCHPCQALTDIYTIKEKNRDLDKITISYIGDGNNVVRSLAFICAKLGISLNVASPKKYELDKETLSLVEKIAVKGFELNLSNDPVSAVKDTDVIYTDTWISMGQEEETDIRRSDFKGFQINSELVSLAKRDVLIMHCLPAHRGEEITDEVIDSPNSIVFDQAENRMHIEKALLKLLIS